MRLIEWSDDFNIGIDAIDAQHRWLVDSINDFYSSFLNGRVDAMDSMLTNIKDFMSEHFKNEEDFLRRYNYPDLESHHEAHLAITQKVKELEAKILNIGVIPFSELTGFMLEWIYGHILKLDKSYAEFIRKVQI